VRIIVTDTDEHRTIAGTFIWRFSTGESGAGLSLTRRTGLRTLLVEVHMTTRKATDARANLYGLIDETNATHEPILITGKRGNAVLISEHDWRSIQETLYLLSIPGMRESIREGLKAPLDKCSNVLKW
jgi:antitoxin YefM